MIFFTLSAAIRVVISLNVPNLNQFRTREGTVLDKSLKPLGDPIGGGGAPY